MRRRVGGKYFFFFNSGICYCCAYVLLVLEFYLPILLSHSIFLYILYAFCASLPACHATTFFQLLFFFFLLCSELNITVYARWIVWGLYLWSFGLMRCLFQGYNKEWVRRFCTKYHSCKFAFVSGVINQADAWLW